MALSKQHRSAPVLPLLLLALASQIFTSSLPASSDSPNSSLTTGISGTNSSRIGVSNQTTTGESQTEQHYKLPSWFSFDLYKRFHGKQYARGHDNELHKRVYLRTALLVFEKRALFRIGRASSLPSLNEFSDQVSGCGQRHNSYDNEKSRRQGQSN